jgi:hypothetical protein
LSSPQTGLATDNASYSGIYADVYLFATPTINGQYCVDAEHQIQTDWDNYIASSQSSECTAVTLPTIDILWNGNSIKNTTQEAIVGQKINLSVAVTGGTPTNLQWTIDGEKVKDYQINIANGQANSATKTDLASQDLNQPSAQFYWVDGGEGRQIQVTATVNGTPYTATTTFNVKRPVVSVTATTNSTTIYTSFEFQELLFGRGPVFGLPPLRGITFTRNDFQVPNGFSGDTFWLQTIDYSVTRTLSDGQTTQTASGVGLDAVFPYSQNDPNSTLTGDQPGFCLKSCNDGVNRSKVQARINAVMWLMFKPKNLPNGEDSIYVPLKKINWNWAANASRGTDGQFTLADPPPTHSENPEVEDTTNFPIWSIIVTGQEPYQ